jgi:hypothetical protein
MITRSPSALETFLTCPQKYAYKYEDRLREPLPSPASEIGSAFHAFMEHMHKHTDCLAQGLTTLDIQTHLVPFVRELRNLEGIDPFQLRGALEELVRGQIQVETLWRSETAAHPLKSEHRGHLELEALNLRVELRIDRMDESAEGVWMIDYKTQATPPGWKEIETFKVLQPWLYSLYGIQEYGDRFLGFVYFLPRIQKVRPAFAMDGAGYNRLLSFVPQKDKMLKPQDLKSRFSALQEGLRGPLQKILAQDFQVRSAPLEACRTCGYRYTCPVARGKGVAHGDV